VGLISPRQMTVEGDFYVRGGIKTVVVARYPG
jgi:NADPH-dependent 7-cyano-7-deazaguanine reductase QueF